VWHIFINRESIVTRVTNRELYRYIVIAYIPAAGLLIWKIIEVYDQGFVLQFEEDGIEYQYHCPNTNSGVYLIIYQVVIALVTLFFCLKARNVPKNFNEDVHIIYLCIFMILIMGFGASVFLSAENMPDNRANIMFLTHFMAAVMMEISVLGRTIYLLVSGKAERHIQSVR